MALNVQTFRTRALTAVVFAAVMLVGLLWNFWSFLILFTIIHFGCWWEYLNLAEKIRKIELHINLKLGLMLLGYGVMLYTPILAGTLFKNISTAYSIGIGGKAINLNFILIAAGTLLTLVGTIQQKGAIALKSFGMAALGLLYISLSWGLVLDLWNVLLGGRPAPIGEPVTMGIVPVAAITVFSIWINDTMAYIVGSFIGKTPLSPISPKKTWEGTIGGIVLAVAVIGLVLINLPFAAAIETYHWFMIPAIAAIAGTFGDLLESKLKRMAGVKDSGSFMPGHGGFLDRFDSLLLAVPFVWLYVNLVVHTA